MIERRVGCLAYHFFLKNNGAVKKPVAIPAK